MAAAKRIRSVCTDLGKHPRDCFEAKPGVSGRFTLPAFQRVYVRLPTLDSSDLTVQGAWGCVGLAAVGVPIAAGMVATGAAVLLVNPSYLPGFECCAPVLTPPPDLAKADKSILNLAGRAYVWRGAPAAG